MSAWVRRPGSLFRRRSVIFVTTGIATARRVPAVCSRVALPSSGNAYASVKVNPNGHRVHDAAEINMGPTGPYGWPRHSRSGTCR